MGRILSTLTWDYKWYCQKCELAWRSQDLAKLFGLVCPKCLTVGDMCHHEHLDFKRPFSRELRLAFPRGKVLDG